MGVLLHDVFFSTIIQNANTHFLPISHRKQGNACRVEFWTYPLLRIYAKLCTGVIPWFLAMHGFTSVKSMREEEKTYSRN